MNKKECARKRQDYYNNKEKILARQKEYRRNHSLQYKTNGHSASLYGVNKRPYPSDGKCEACRVSNKWICYHHSDDNNIEHGIWLCRNCHNIVEWVIRNPGTINILMEYTTGQKRLRLPNK